ncbi:UNKNOWN [Stylonychia lemnae]|uniref:IMS import disulfide relay-system CHCH-CHCH-like Cx9C domain-containing protein n=1 Tax=Stylonychia lemnae TaxID=5949 RepID=A0A078B6D7_STYLE|nr:UNKNOWN [Stylonychia lemnae]|eukprot:CDW90090.1 UNKNOWN [Stylonychia lemnae]
MQGVDTDSTVKNLIYGFKGASFCAKERGDFVLCRATPAGRLGDPELCEGKVANFLQCYHDMVKHTSASCQNQYKGAYDCLKSNFDVKDTSKMVSCKELVDDFASCK